MLRGRAASTRESGAERGGALGEPGVAVARVERGVDVRGRVLLARRPAAAAARRSPCGRSSGSSTVPSPVPSCGPSRRKNGTSAPTRAASACSSAAGAARRAARSRAAARSRRRSCRRRGRPRPGCASRSARRHSPPSSASALRTIVSSKPSTVVSSAGSTSISSRELERLVDGRELVLPVGPQRPDDEREVDLRAARSPQRLLERHELRRLERLRADAGGAADRVERLDRALARGEPGERERVRERLPAVRERRRRRRA